jgi:glycosyltransferase involved in cell wall biosynthesis
VSGLGVSVALCTFNGGPYISDLLESIAAQDLQPAELVVSDDRSTDDTRQIVEAFVTHAPFPVRLGTNESNLGPVKNFEATIARCDSDLIALCDQDDIWTPQRLRRAVETFDAHPDIGFAFSDAELINEAGGSLWDAIGFTGERRATAERGDLLPLLIPYTVVTGATMTFRADLRGYVLPIGENWVHDAWIALTSAMVRPYAMLPERLIRYRIHAAQEIGVPTGPNLDTFTGKWKTRLRAAAALGNSDVTRQRRRQQARRYGSVVERFRTEGASYLERAGLQPQPLTEATVSTLEEQATHAHVRGTLPDRRSQRLDVIREEWKTGRYKRFSAGTLSAVQDLLY